MKDFYSGFKNENDVEQFFSWANKLQQHNKRYFNKTEVESLLGKTTVWTLNERQTSLPALVIFPGFRTSPLFWDLCRRLKVVFG